MKIQKKRKYNGHVCSAPGCSNSYGKDKSAGVKRSYYSFPMQDRKRLQAWLKKIPQDKWSPTIHSKICGDHFAGGLHGYYFETFFL